MSCFADVQVPQEYGFHPGHMWVHDEGHQNARVGIDAFAGDLFGQIDSIEIDDLNRWVRHGQKICTVKHGEQSVGMLSPVEGVVVSINHEVLKNPGLIASDPYRNGWVCVVKAPERRPTPKTFCWDGSSPHGCITASPRFTG